MIKNILSILFWVLHLKEALCQIEMDADTNQDLVQIFSVSRLADKDNGDRLSSLEGGTLFYIKGTGFDLKITSNNIAFTGDYPCNVEGVNSAFLMCSTTAVPDEIELPLKIYVKRTSGIKTSVCAISNCNIVFKASRTPYIYRIEAQSASPMTYINFTGIFKVGNTEDLYQFKISKFICDRDDLDNYAIGLWNWIKVMCRVAPETPGGFHNATIYSMIGEGEKSPDFYGFKLSDGQRFGFRCVPEITSISQNNGSINGQILHIGGYGFSKNTSQIKVSIENVNCKILKSSLTSLDCEVESVPDIPVYDQKYFRGGAGFKYRVFARSPVDYCNFQNGGLRNAIWDENNTALPTLILEKTLLELQTPYEDGDSDYYIDVSEGFFYAPYTGSYRFFTSGDDNYEVWLSSEPYTKSKDKMVKIAFLNGWTSYQHYYDQINQISSNIELEGGKYYYMENYHCEGSGASHFTVSVEIPKDVAPGADNNLDSVIEISVDAEKINEVFEIRIYGWTSGEYVFKYATRDPVTKEVTSTKESRKLGRNATDVNVRDALGDLGFDKLTVLRSSLDSNGNIIPTTDKTTIVAGFLYNVTYTYFQGVVLLPSISIVTPDSGKKTPLTSVKSVQSQSPAIRGTFELTFGDIKTGPLDYSIESWDLKAKLRGKVGKYVNDNTEIWRYYRPDDGCMWRIRFRNVVGPLPAIIGENTLMTGGVEGKRPVINIKSKVTGSNRIFVEPISSDFLFRFKSKPQVKIEVNEVIGHCTSVNCDYDFIKDVVPVIDNFIMKTSSENYVNLEIMLSNYDKVLINSDTIQVMYGGFYWILDLIQLPYLVLSYNDYSQKYQFDAAKLEAGKPLRIFIKNIGYAIYKVESIKNQVLKPIIKNLNQYMGGTEGGLRIFIFGFYFPLEIYSDLRVFIGSSPCRVLTTETSCMYIALGKKIDSNIITIEYNGVKSEGYSGFTFNDTGIPIIHNISVKSASPSLKSEIAIYGENFDNVDVFSEPIPDDSFQFVERFDLANYITLGIVSVTKNKIVAILTGGKTGRQRLYVFDYSYGNSKVKTPDAADYRYEIIVDTISPSEGSYFGGTILSIKGRNFSPFTNQNQVYIGEDNIMCDVLESSQTEIKCRTKAVNDPSYIGKVHKVYVTQRVMDEAVCSQEAGCNFKYINTGVPSISITESSMVIKVIGNQEVTLEGINFGVSSTDFLGQVSFDSGLRLNLTKRSDTSISFVFPVLTVGIFKITSIYLNNIGNIFYDKSIELANEIRILGISKSDVKRGGDYLDVLGNGFKQDFTVYIEGQGVSNLGFTRILSISPDKISIIVPIGTDRKTYLVTVRDKTVRYTNDSACTFTVYSNSTTIVKSDRYKDSKVTNTEKIPLQLTGSLFNTTDSSSIVFEIQTYYESELSVINKNIQKYVATQLQVNESDLIGTFTNVPSGRYRFSVYMGQSNGFALFSAGKQVNISIENLKGQGASSFTGGGMVMITGNNFPEYKYWVETEGVKNNRISVCGMICPVIEASPTKVKCSAPTFVTPKIQAAYKYLTSKVVTPVAITSDIRNPAIESRVQDGLLSTFYLSNTVGKCFILFTLSELNSTVELTLIRYFPKINTPIGDFKGLVFQASLDNITYDNLFELDPNIKTGWNEWIPPPNKYYRYLRIISNSNQHKSQCQFAEIELFGYKYYYPEINDLTSSKCDIEVLVNGEQGLLSGAVEYVIAKSPVILDFSPKSGSTGGDTVVTFSGKYIGNIKSDLKIWFDGIECIVEDFTTISDATTFTCRTGKRPYFVEPSILITVNNSIAITTNLTFDYIDSWSDPRTWGGEIPPREGDSVYIPPGQVVYIDVSTPVLNAILVEGTLIFGSKYDEMTFDAYYVIVRGGKIRIGTLEKPFEKYLTITMHGTIKTKFLPEFGNKCFGTHGGTIEINGIPRKTFTFLKKTAEKGDQSIELVETVDWKTGEEIVIASTSFNHNESELVKVLNSKENIVNFYPPLKYRHYSGVEDYNGKPFPMRAEVALLTRNIRFQGKQNESHLDEHGAHMMFHLSNSVGRISYTEFVYVGQGTFIGRYPIHFHRIGECHKCYAIGNSVHESYARVTTLHGTDFLTIQKNVGYNVYGHNYFVEDGVEENNVIEDNLGISTKQIWTLMKSDVTAATFWITNPNNIIRRNYAAGSDWYGFWYELNVDFKGPSYTTDVCPSGKKLGIFENNVAHSNNRFGLRIFTYVPRKYPCTDFMNSNLEDVFSDNPPILAVFENFWTWKNFDTAVRAFHIGMVEFRNFFIADSKVAGFDISITDYTYEDGPLINGSLIVAVSKNNSEDPSLYKEARGIITPRTDNMLIQNVEFHNFANQNMTTFESCSKCWHLKLKISGGKTTKFKNITFFNSSKRIVWIGLKKEIFIDLDGSMTGLPGASITPAYPHLIGLPECTLSPDTWDNAVICNNKIQLRSVLFENFLPHELFLGVEMKILRLAPGFDSAQAKPEQYTVAKMIKIFVDTPDSWGWTFATGYSYSIHWHSGLDFNHLTLKPSPIYNAKDLPFVMRFNHSDIRESFNVSVSKSDKLSTQIQKSSMLLAISKNNIKTGDYFQDMANKMIYLGVSGVNRGIIDVNAIRCTITCPKPSEDVNKENFLRLWSNASMWPNQILPPAGADVLIPGQWRVILDIDALLLGYLEIEGDLIFDERRDISKISAEKIWVKNGGIYAGERGKPFTNKIEIQIIGSKKSPDLLIDAGVEGGNKVLAVTGNLHLFGEEKKVIWTKLAKFAKAGELTIELIDVPDWKVDDEIVIGPTGFDPKENEMKKIVKIEGNVITLNTSLIADHYGAPKVTRVTEYGTLDMRAAVGLLTRNIVITSDSQDSWGVRVLFYQYKTTNNLVRRGNAQLHGVEIKKGGQYDTWKASLDFQYVLKGEASVFNRSAIHSAFGWCLSAESSQNITVLDSVFYNCEKFNSRVLNSNYFTYRRNLMIYARKRPSMDSAETMLYDMVAGLDMYIPVDNMIYDVRNNLVQGSEGVGFVMASPRCKEETGFVNNTAGSSLVGFIAHKNTSGCIAITDFVAYRNDLGLISVFTAPGKNLSKLVFAENRINYNVWLGQDGLDLQMYHSNIYVIALAITDCPECYKVTEHCSNRQATYFSVNQVSGFSIPIKKSSPLGLASVCKESPGDSKTYAQNIVFENFRLDYSDHEVVAWRNCKDNRVYQTWSTSPDAAADLILKNVTCKNCQKAALVLFTEENPKLLGWLGGCLFQCTGKKNIHVTDMDGQFIGKIGQIVPANEGLEKMDNCRPVSEWNGLECDGYTIGKILFESIGEDALSRIVAPVNISSEKMYNVLNQWKEWQWEGPEPLDKRRPRFNGLIELDKRADVLMHGTIPMLLRFKLERPLSPKNFVVLKIKFMNPETTEVLKGSTLVKPYRLDENIDLMTKSDICGANIYDYINQTLEFVVTGEDDCLLYLRRVNSVKISMRMEVKIEDFFNNNGGADFLDKITAYLNIDTSRLRIVNVRSGSTLLDFLVVEKTKPINDSSTQTPANSDDFVAPKPVDVIIDKNQALADFNVLKEDLETAATKIKEGVLTGEVKLLGTVTSVSSEMKLIPVNASIINNSNSTDSIPNPTQNNSKDSSTNTAGIIVGIVVAVVVALVISFCVFYKNSEGKRIIVLAKEKCFPRRKKLDSKKTVGGMEMEKADVLYKDYYKKSLDPDANPNQIDLEKKK